MLFEEDDLALEFFDVGRRAEPGGPPCLLAEQFGQPLLQLLAACGGPDAALLRGEEICLQRGAGDDRSGRRGAAWLGFSGVDSFEKVAVPVEERAVHPGLGRDAADADLLAGGERVGERLGDTLAAPVGVGLAAVGLKNLGPPSLLGSA